MMNPLLQAKAPDHAVMSALFQYSACVERLCTQSYFVEFAVSACILLPFELLV